MNPIFDAFWRSVAYCLHPRVILLSFLPLVLMIGITGGLGYFFWEPAIDHIRTGLESSHWLNSAWHWLERVGLGQLKSVLAPIIVIAIITPLVVVVSLLAVALLMTPVIVQLVAKRRFADLEPARGGSFLGSVAWSLGSTAIALVALVLSTPLWLVPPLVLVVPPLIWGWLTYRVMAFDALAEHATVEERHALLRQHRVQLLGMGVFAGYLGAAPSLIWSLGVMTIVMAPILVPVSIWMYTLIFAFSSLWFSHYCLAALRELRRQRAVPGFTTPLAALPAAPVVLLPPSP